MSRRATCGFPPALRHSIQGLGPDGGEFVIVFDDGVQSESNTLLMTDWFTHTPPDILAKNSGVTAETFANIPLHNLWIFQADAPGNLAADKAAATVVKGTESVIFRLAKSKVLNNSGRAIQVADSSNFTLSKTAASALITVEPGE
jgi:oxalate decarboxylase